MKRNFSDGTLFVFLAIIGYVFSMILNVVKYLIFFAAIIALICIGIFLLYRIYSTLYFNSERFSYIKLSIQKYIKNCNDLNHHINELKTAFIKIKSYDYGNGQLYDNSNYNFARKEWSLVTKSKYIHHCSASVLKNASNQPFKYLCKYFNIETKEETLSSFESVLNDFAAAEQGKVLLQRERDEIL